MRVRPYRPETDSDALRRCFVELHEAERTLEPRLPPGEQIADAYLAWMHERCTQWDGAVLVAETDGSVAGFVAVWARVPPDEPDEPSGTYAHVSDLVVLSHHRGRGIGTALLAQAERFARERGATLLRIGVLARNVGARRLYERAGFADYHVHLVKRLER